MLKARNRRRPALAGVALALALAAGGCTGFVNQHGNKLDERRYETVEPGVTTKAEVAQVWGTPSARSTFDDKTWYYISSRTERLAFFAPETTEQRVVVVRFDDSERVAAIEEKGLEDAREVATVDRTTPTIGNEPGLLEMLYTTLLEGPVGALGGPVENEGFARP